MLSKKAIHSPAEIGRILVGLPRNIGAQLTDLLQDLFRRGPVDSRGSKFRDRSFVARC
jgi:hypothetical protein